MATVSRSLPEHPHLDVPKREARELLDQWRKGEPDAFERIRRRHPRFEDADDGATLPPDRFQAERCSTRDRSRVWLRQLDRAKAAHRCKLRGQGIGSLQFAPMTGTGAVAS